MILADYHVPTIEVLLYSGYQKYEHFIVEFKLKLLLTLMFIDLVIFKIF